MPFPSSDLSFFLSSVRFLPSKNRNPFQTMRSVVDNGVAVAAVVAVAEEVDKDKKRRRRNRACKKNASPEGNVKREL